MTKHLLKIIASVLLFTYSTSMAFAETEVDIVYVSKMAEIDTRENKAGGLAELHSLINTMRQSKENTLFLHGGDFLAGSLMSSFDKGTHMIDVLNSMEPDAVVINERELAFKEDELSLRIQESAFPYLNSNITDPLTGGGFESTEESMCYEMGELDVCVFGVLDPMVVESYPPDRIFVDPNIDLIEKKARSLREDGADIIILMASHAENDLKRMLEKQVVDLVFYSNSNEDVVMPVGQGMFLKQGTDKGKAITVKIVGGNDATARYSAEIVSLHVYEPEPHLAKKINYYLSTLDRIMDAPEGRTTTKLTSQREKVRTEETAIGNLVADALRDYYQADIAFVNGGSIRGNRDYPAGAELTRKDIQSELPFDSLSVLFVASGQNILDALENGLSMVENVKGRFLQVSGLNLVWCPDAPVGQRVRSVMINGKPVDPLREYTVATSEYLYNGGDGYTMFTENKPIRSKKVKLILWELVRAYIGKRGKVSPKIEDRIVRACKK